MSVDSQAHARRSANRKSNRLRPCRANSLRKQLGSGQEAIRIKVMPGSRSVKVVLAQPPLLCLRCPYLNTNRSVRLFRGEHLDLDAAVLGSIERIDGLVPPHAIDVESVRIKSSVFFEQWLPYAPRAFEQIGP